MVGSTAIGPRLPAGVLRSRSVPSCGELGEQADLAADQLVPVAEVEALVLAVDAAAGIGGPEQQRGDAAERVGERPDERDGAADAHAHRVDAEAGAQRAVGGVERPAGRARSATPAPRRAA